MPRSMEITVREDGIKSAAEKMAEFAANTRDAAKAARDVKSAADRIPVGPAQRLLSLQRAAGAVSGIGDPAQRAAAEQDLAILQFRAQRSLILGQRRLAQGQSALGAPGLLDLFQMFAGAAGGRGGMGGIGGIARAVGGVAGVARAGGAAAAIGGAEAGGAVAALAPLAAVAGPIAIALAAATLAVTTFAEMVRAAADQLSALRSAALTSGGTAGTVAGLRAFGIEPGAVPGAAGGLRGRMGSDPLAMGRFGYAPPRGLVPFDEAGALSRAMHSLRDEYRRLLQTHTAEQSALVTLNDAQKGGLEGYMAMITASRELARGLDWDVQLAKEIASPANTQAAADFTGQLQRLGGNMQLIGQAAAIPYLKDWAHAIGVIGDLAHNAAGTMTHWGWAVRLIIDRAVPFIGFLDNFAQFLGLFGKKSQRQKDHDDALNANTDALLKTAAAYRAGTFGGGARTASAIPAAMKGWLADNHATTGSIRYGGIGL